MKYTVSLLISKLQCSVPTVLTYESTQNLKIKRLGENPLFFFTNWNMAVNSNMEKILNCYFNIFDLEVSAQGQITQNLI